MSDRNANPPVRVPRLNETPTHGELEDACLSFDHGFGLMPEGQQQKMRNTAREWWRCVARSINRTLAETATKATDGDPTAKRRMKVLSEACRPGPCATQGCPGTACATTDVNGVLTPLCSPCTDIVWDGKFPREAGSGPFPIRIVACQWQVVIQPVDQYGRDHGAPTILTRWATRETAEADLPNHGAQTDPTGTFRRLPSGWVPHGGTGHEFLKVVYREVAIER